MDLHQLHPRFKMSICHVFLGTSVAKIFGKLTLNIARLNLRADTAVVLLSKVLNLKFLCQLHF
uniref:Uncharacterized protein n=1 Tax=Anguilla anguilla TaxID=7936 RepID=A0A0E9X264_ANGAN